MSWRVRAAAAFCIDGIGYQEMSPAGECVDVPGGFFVCIVIPRHECVYIHQVSYL